MARMAGPLGSPRAFTPPALVVDAATASWRGRRAPEARAVAPAARLAASCDSSGVGGAGCLTIWTRKMVVATWCRMRDPSWS